MQCSIQQLGILSSIWVVCIPNVLDADEVFPKTDPVPYCSLYPDSPRCWTPRKKNESLRDVPMQVEPFESKDLAEKSEDDSEDLTEENEDDKEVPE